MFERSSKRALDIIVASTGLLVAAPALAILSVLVRLESPGPALFRQVRVGRKGRPIVTLKLRTMVDDAAKRGPLITAGHDSRITPLGRWLRKTKLDELPQLWNVLRGDMSLVGPRPEVPAYVALYRPEWRQLLTVRPGLTDLASLTFRDEEALLADISDTDRAYREVIMPMKLELSLAGIERSSVKHDLELLVMTVFAVANRRPVHDHIITEARRRIEELDWMTSA